MTMNELINTLGIVDKDEIKHHPKMILFLDYINKNDVDVFEHGFMLLSSKFKLLLENIYSFDVLLEILKKSADLLSINFDGDKMARFYNLYDPRVIQYNKDALILIDDEYLKYVSVEWTNNCFLNIKKVLYVSDKRIMLKDNHYEVESYLLNLRALNEAKKLGLLKKAILKLVNIK